jgi:hypothetical protein
MAQSSWLMPTLAAAASSRLTSNRSPGTVQASWCLSSPEDAEHDEDREKGKWADHGRRDQPVARWGGLLLKHGATLQPHQWSDHMVG